MVRRPVRRLSREPDAGSLFHLDVVSPLGVCRCGCGQQTVISTWTSSDRRYIRGIPRQYLQGHNRRGYHCPPWPVVILPNGDRRIPLAKGGVVAAWTVISAESAKLAEYRWYLDDRGYAHRTVGRRYVSLARLIVDAFDSDEVDHINRDPLDNRLMNLRLVSHRSNQQNQSLRRGTSSRHRGVYRCAGKWRAYATVNYKRIHLGVFDDEDEAARVAHEFRESNYLGYTGPQ